MSISDKQLDAMAVLLDSLREGLNARPISDAGRTALSAADDLLAELKRVNALCDRLDAANEELAGRLHTVQDELAAQRLEAAR